MQSYNYLKDASFLKLLDQTINKFYWVKIEVLDLDERPIQSIEGRIMPGSTISIDGDSAVRRTCSLTFVADEEENDLENLDNLLSINKKIKVYTGIKNDIDNRYDDIIWFKQGIFVITQPSINHNSGGCTITLSCKDKMCLLNGECGGSFPTSVTFHEYTQIIGEQDCGTEDPAIFIENPNEYTVYSYCNVIPATVQELKEVFINDWATYMDHRQLRDSEITTIATYWSLHPNYNLYLTWDSYNSARASAVVAPELTSAAGGYQVYSGKAWYYWNYSSSGPYFIMTKESTLDSSYFMFITETTVFHDSGKATDYGHTTPRIYKMWKRNRGWYEVSSTMIGQMVDLPQLFYDIIQTLVCNYGGEAISRIFINDVPLEIKQLVRYTGSKPLYYNIATGVYTVNADYVTANSSDNWKVFNYNEDVGYVYTDFVYPGELISNIGDNVCTILDKIKTTLGNYEYFYDVEGNFVFQEKKNYLNNSYDPVNRYRLDNNRKVETPAVNDLAIIDGTNYQVDFSSNDELAYSFTEGDGLVASYVNTPVYSNLKNDFHIWGISEDKNAIHYHFAIKKKPKESEFNTYQVVFIIKDGKYTGGLRLAGVSDQTEDIVDYTPADWRAELYLRGLTKQKLGQRPDIYEQELLDLFDGIYDFKESKFKADMVYRPNDLNYFFDYLEPIDDLYDCSVDALKTKIYSYKQDKVIKLYDNEVPNQILIGLNIDAITRANIIERCEREGQSYVNVNSDINNHLSIGTIGYSAQEVARNLLYQYTNYNESISIQCMPIFYLEPNRRISVYDQKSGISGDYVIKSISIPIGANNFMTINAIKSYARI